MVAVVLSGKTKAQLLQRRCAGACCAKHCSQMSVKIGQAWHTQHCVGMDKAEPNQRLRNMRSPLFYNARGLWGFAALVFAFMVQLPIFTP